MDIKGTITWVGELQSGESEHGKWESQDIVVEYGSTLYPKKACFRLGSGKLQKYIGKKEDGTNNYEHLEPHIGMKGTFTFEVDARESKGRWFNTLRCYQYAPLTNDAPTTENAPQGEEKKDDLPY